MKKSTMKVDFVNITSRPMDSKTDILVDPKRKNI